MRNNKGLTVMGLLILIVVGVLGIKFGIPYFKNSMEFAKSVEALAYMGPIHKAIDRCYEFYGESGFDSCSDWKSLEVDNPTFLPGAHFQYSFETTGSAQAYDVIAIRNATNNGNVGDKIVLRKLPGSISRYGTGAFANIK